MSIEKLPAYLTNFPMASSQCTMQCITSSVAIIKISDDLLYHRALTMTLTHLNAHGLGKPLDDGEKGEGSEQGGLVAVGVHDLAHRAVGSGQPSVLQLKTRPGQIFDFDLLKQMTIVLLIKEVTWIPLRPAPRTDCAVLNTLNIFLPL